MFRVAAAETAAGPAGAPRDSPARLEHAGDPRGATDDADVEALRRTVQDPQAFAPLYARYFHRVYAFCLRRSGTPQEAEDLASEVFARALANARSHRGGSVAAWLFRIARNAVANHLRSRAQLTAPGQVIEIIVADETTAGQAFEEPMLERLIREEEYQRVRLLIAALPDAQREMLALKLSGELSAGDIGAVLGMSEGAVRVALHRAIQQLRHAYYEGPQTTQERAAQLPTDEGTE